MSGSRSRAAEGHDLRLLPAAGLAWPAAWWATAAPPRAAALAALSCAAAGGVLLATARHRRGVPQAALALALTALVLIATWVALAVRAAGPVPAWALARAASEASGRVGEDPRRVAAGPFGGPDRWVVPLAAARVSARGGAALAHGPVTVLGTGGWQRARVGDRVQTTGRLLPPRPGEKEVAGLVATGDPRLVARAGWPWRVADRLRAGLRGACAGLGRDVEGLLPALVDGDVTRLPEDLRVALRDAGLAHLTAVSGANLTIVTAAAVGGAATLGLSRRARPVVAAGALAGFVVLARPQPSVLRAAVMGGVALLGLVAGRAGRGMPALCAAVVGLLGVDPWLSRSYGFALSALATAGLLVLVRPLTAVLARRLPRALALAVAVPAAAQLATAPVAVLLRPSVSLVAVPANLLAAPAVAPATVLGVVAAVLSVVSGPAAHLVAVPASAATWWIAVVARWTAALPAASLPWPDGVPGAALLAVVTGVPVAVVLAAGGFRRRRGADGPRVPRRSRPGPRLAVAGLVLAVAAGWWGGPPVAGRAAGLARAAVAGPGGVAGWPPRGWRAVQCDVGQGDALVIRSGPDRAVLVDAGPDPGRVDTCLRRLGVRRLDLVVVTHYHSDHAAGLAGALRGRRVAEVLVSPFGEPAGAAREVAREARAVGARVVRAWAGGQGSTGTPDWPVSWAVLWPPVPGGAGGAPGPTTVPDPVLEDGDSLDGSAANDASVVLAVRAGPLGLVALGDLETAAQAALAGQIEVPAPVDVVKVAHHGSARQDPGLYARLRPRVALIGVGRHNDYGHPVPSTLAMLRAGGILVLRTDTEGDVGVVTAGGGFAVATAGPDP